jgi:hypothetical protein
LIELLKQAQSLRIAGLIEKLEMVAVLAEFLDCQQRLPRVAE